MDVVSRLYANTTPFHIRDGYPGGLISTNTPKIWKNDYTSFLYPNHPSRSFTVLHCRTAHLSPSSLPQISLGILRDCPLVPQTCPGCPLPSQPPSGSRRALSDLSTLLAAPKPTLQAAAFALTSPQTWLLLIPLSVS